MNGIIGVESIVGKGSTFYVELEQLEKPAAKESVVTKQSTLEVPHHKIGKKYTILYIEDNPDNLKLVEQALNINKNIIFKSAPQAEQGIQLSKTCEIDLVLMDINLPGMDDLATIGRGIRQRSLFKMRGKPRGIKPTCGI